jgi:hypothetical protein
MSFTLTGTFHVPSGYDPHAPILTFLRTSDFGVWQLDKKKINDGFEMNLKRGKFGFFKKYDTYGTHPAYLKLLFRPSVQSTRVTLDFNFPKAWKRMLAPEGHNYKSKPVYIHKLTTALKDYVDREVVAMKEYIKEFHGLADLDLPGPE